MILVIDNYDSFTWNLVHYLQQLGASVEVVRNDALTASAALALAPEAIVLSPGPGTPADAGICRDVVAAAADAGVALLGVCLGHQAIGEVFGGQVVRGAVMHGKTSPIDHDASGVFAGLPSPFTATRYHSLIVAADSISAVLVANAHAGAGGARVVMGLRHREHAIHGVQFHPESIASDHGHALLANFLRLAGVAHVPLAVEPPVSARAA